MKIFHFVKKIVKAILPHGIIALRDRANLKKIKEQQALNHKSNRFWQGYLDYINNPEHRVKLLEDCPFRQIVSVQGFGYSGSGAVLDLLREYDCNYVVGYVDNEGTVMQRPTTASYEVPFLTAPGGLIEIEHFLNVHNLGFSDAVLHRFILMIEKSEIFLNTRDVRPYIYEFFYQLLDYMVPESKCQYYTTYLNYEGNNCMLHLKPMQVKDYRNLCRRFLYSLFSLYKTNNTIDTLVLDQFANDYEFNISRCIDYLPELKIISVYRDPRDIFEFAQRCNEEWLPADIEAYLQHCALRYKFFELNTNEICVVKFEELIMNYDVEVARIEEYLCLTPANHKNKGMALSPGSSAKNIGNWKKDITHEADYQKIKEQHPRLCN